MRNNGLIGRVGGNGGGEVCDDKRCNVNANVVVVVMIMGVVICHLVLFDE